MSILITGMGMPKGCVYRENSHLIACPLYDSDGYCGILNVEASHKENRKLSHCPLIELPPHERLIDANELFKEMERKGWFDNSDRDKAEDLVLDAPTIIEAELLKYADNK